MPSPDMLEATPHDPAAQERTAPETDEQPSIADRWHTVVEQELWPAFETQAKQAALTAWASIRTALEQQSPQASAAAIPTWIADLVSVQNRFVDDFSARVWSYASTFGPHTKKAVDAIAHDCRGPFISLQQLLTYSREDLAAGQPISAEVLDGYSRAFASYGETQKQLLLNLFREDGMSHPSELIATSVEEALRQFPIARTKLTVRIEGVDASFDRRFALSLRAGSILTSALRELVINAIKELLSADRTDGMITLSTTYDSKQAEMIIRIRDNGRGFLPEAQQALDAQRPFTNNAFGVGTGQGFLAHQQSVQALPGAYLEREATGPDGTTVAVHVPEQSINRIGSGVVGSEPTLTKQEAA